MSSELYNGHWMLLQELSIYQRSEPPLSGEYRISSNGEIVEFEVLWKDSAGLDDNLSFGGPLDGQKHITDSPGISHICYEKISESTLDSMAFDDDDIVLYARRTVSADGQLMAVSQVHHGEHGKSSNFQVYRRKDA